MLRIVNQYREHEDEEYPLEIDYISPKFTFLKVLSVNELFFPRFLMRNLHVGQEVEVRMISAGEYKYSHALEMLNRPIDWWTAKPGFETLLIAQKLKPTPPILPPNCDMIDNYFDNDQKKAISAAIDDNRRLVVIHGPCGSGKTVVASEVIKKVV